MILPLPGDVADKIERFNRGEADVNDWRDLLSDAEVDTILAALRNEAARSAIIQKCADALVYCTYECDCTSLSRKAILALADMP